jgi:hypothetical protein
LEEREMVDKYLLIPGTSGCKLLLNGEDVGYPTELYLKAWLAGTDLFAGIVEKLGFSADKLVDLLSMEWSGGSDEWAPLKTTRLKGEITAGPTLAVAYNQFTDYAQFNYDWRSDIRHNGEKLLDFLKTRKPEDGKWRILAHSQGGLLVAVASRLCGVGRKFTEFSKYVRKVAFLACPFAGSVNSAEALICGDNLTNAFSEHFKKAIRTWPSIYQMLPRWEGSIQNRPGAATLLEDSAWRGVAIDLSLLERARQTHRRFFEQPLKYLSGVEVRLVNSASWDTHNTIDGSGAELRAAGREPGDTLVPLATTRMALSDQERQAMHTLGAQTPKGTLEHWMLANDPVFATEIDKFLK